MLENVVAKVVHVTKRLKVFHMDAESAKMGKADIGDLKTKHIIAEDADIGILLDNDKVYGKTSDFKGLTIDKNENKNDAGKVPRPARADHTHKIPDKMPNPKSLILKGNDGKEAVSYNGSAEKELKLTADLVGAAKKNHASTTTDFGKGDQNNFGHLKLTADNLGKDANYGQGDGVAVTPKYVARHYVTKEGDSTINGWLKIQNSVLIGGTPNIPSDNTLWIKGVGDPNIAKIRLGNKIFSLENDGHIYLHQEGNLWRQLIDYEVEAIIVGDSQGGANRWSPSRDGWYRVYMVGGGGISAPAVVTKNTGIFQNNGSGIGGCNVSGGRGGGGGGVVILDIDAKPPNARTSVDTGDTEDGDDDDNANDMEGEAYALFEFFSESFRSTDTKNLTDSNGNVIKRYRAVGVSGISNIGTLLNRHNSGSHYDAVAGHGYDATKQNNESRTGTYASYGSTAVYPGTDGNKDVDGNGLSSKQNTVAHGCCGGVPGEIGITGVVGGKGAPGNIVNIKSYSSSGVTKYVTGKNGDGGSLCIHELDNYTCNPALVLNVSDSRMKRLFPESCPTTSTGMGGSGYLGGGNGGGYGTVTLKSNATSHVTKKAKRNASVNCLNACVIIVYMGKVR